MDRDEREQKQYQQDDFQHYHYEYSCFKKTPANFFKHCSTIHLYQGIMCLVLHMAAFKPAGDLPFAGNETSQNLHETLYKVHFRLQSDGLGWKNTNLFPAALLFKAARVVYIIRQH